MTASVNDSDPLMRLLHALADDALTNVDRAQLASLLRNDVNARQVYYKHVKLTALLRREGRRDAALRDMLRDGIHQPAENEVDSASRRGCSEPKRKSRMRNWLPMLGASVLLGVGLLSVGEATGITQLVPTVIRIMTGEGALVIEVDDPTVSVSLDGEDVTITGSGIHELRLKPGTHKFRATKDGQALYEEVVTIKRGGRKIVRVVRENSSQSHLDEMKETETPRSSDLPTAELARRSADVERNPSDIEARFQRGLASARLNLLDEALADYSYVIESQPDRPEYSGAYMGRGEIRQGRGDWTGAIADFGKRAELKPLEGMASGRMALIYLFGPFEHRDPQKAAQNAERAARAEPHNNGYVLVHGIACYRLGRLDEAIQTLERAAALSPGADGRDLYALAMCYHATGQAEKASACHAQAAQAWERTKSAQTATQLNFWHTFREEAEAVLAVP